MISVLMLLLAAGAGQLTPVDQEGYRKLVESHRGKVLLVDFWATWCDPCRAELPVLAALEKKLRARGLVLVTISADEPEQDADARALLEKSGIPRPVYRKQVENNEDFINSIDRQWSGALPALFLYDRQGRRIQSFIGETDASELEAAVSRLL